MIRLLRLIDRALGALFAACSVLAAMVLLILMGLTGYVVVMRRVLSQPPNWSQEVLAFGAVFVVMLVVAEALWKGAHIGIDIVTERLPRRVQQGLALLAHLAVSVVALVLMLAGWEMVVFSYELGLASEGYLGVKLVWVQAPVPIGAGLLLLAAVGQMLAMVPGVRPTAEPIADAEPGAPMP